MIEKEGEAEKTNHFRSFVFEQRRQENSEERFADIFSRKGVRGSENKKSNKKTKETNKNDERNDKSKKHPSEGNEFKNIWKKKEETEENKICKIYK